MPYSADKPSRARSAEELRAAIPGWGVDLDPADRPAYPRERFDPDSTGAHWTMPDQQPGWEGRERSIEHERVTPVFGTSAPLHGMSGIVRRFAYRYSEGRAAHWLILLAGDRVDSVTAHLRSFVTAGPDNPITQTGIRSELTHHGMSSRRGTRVDRNHEWIDPIVVAGPWLAVIAAVTAVSRAVLRR
ncbi:hypothetical protein HQO38_17355 [Rhodococcus fascians]|jgi:hypothetical protein|uniref:hypothetical protein n=1 Tax=Rhodococcoides fascians TaxID=1828 RepID=UPI001427C178|nr:hypothetical protein [Rhodococcus sp. (in: high G+C Gram-positive bacteria)]MBY3989050.1 hypothetical protein [Rhodococcus fascians]MBJ7324220.1 hypothetical protein [Rhodococcus sp. (in: high G+C Gram-positive bacteria)]MBY3998695.1 hypothetical protein [Rhodococcus fascians]MBY4003441.1 hypothetical protein [Rhodococcus fascians]MBY4008191.1 hypothetical protein [Rhodococcus fascians]